MQPNTINVRISYLHMQLNISLLPHIPLIVLFEQIKNKMGIDGPSSNFLMWFKKPYEIAPIPLGTLGLSPQGVNSIIIISKKDYKVIDSYLNSYFPNIVSETLQCPVECLQILDQLNTFRSYFKFIVDNIPKIKTIVHSLLPKETLETVKGDEKLKKLFEWFCSFFQYQDVVYCHNCGKPTVLEGPGPVLPSELQGMPYATEMHVCQSCGARTRFPRYSNPLVLLKKPVGREHEAIILLISILYSLDYTVRIVANFVDHQWVEVWSEDSQRYIPLDPITKTFDCPLIYECGWKMRLNYIIAISPYECVDVTKRYSMNHEKLAEFREANSFSQWINKSIAHKNQLLLNLCSQTHRTKLKEYQKLDAESMERDSPPTPKPEELQPRLR